MCQPAITRGKKKKKKVERECWWFKAPWILEQGRKHCAEGQRLCAIIQQEDLQTTRDYQRQKNLPIPCTRSSTFRWIVDVNWTEVLYPSLSIPAFAIQNRKCVILVAFCALYRWGERKLIEMFVGRNPCRSSSPVSSRSGTNATPGSGQSWLCLAKSWKLPRTEIPLPFWVGCFSVALLS